MCFPAHTLGETRPNEGKCNSADTSPLGDHGDFILTVVTVNRSAEDTGVSKADAR